MYRLYNFSRAQPVILLATVYLFAMVMTAIIAPLIAPYDPNAIASSERLQSPRGTHWFGTDHFGRDIFSRVLYGTRVSLLAAAWISCYTLAFGLVLGLSSGYFTPSRHVLMRIVDALMAFPSIMLALVFRTIFGPGLHSIVLALGIAYTPTTARLVFGSALAIREKDYVDSARAIGASHFRILGRYLLPNLASPLIVQTTYVFAISLIGAAAMDFLGVGLPPYIPSWGGMLSEGRVYMTLAPWIMTMPGVFIVLTVLSVNVLGDALRDRLDPRLSRLR